MRESERVSERGRESERVSERERVRETVSTPSGGKNSIN